MGRQQHIRVEARSEADPAVVHRLLCDGSTWPAWSPITSVTLERPAPDGTEGVGAVRLVRTERRTGTVRNREEIVEIVPDRRFSYVLLSGMPLRDYRADVDLAPGDGGTVIRWHSSFVARRSGTGWLYRLVLDRFIRRLVDGLAAYAATTSRT